ncbi:MAG: hypothetical protein A6F71_02605 [Cycloclasticus sp. symbiont of Poecilosclerida sp. M]|nr:MAG: hypothetical protein A6F71_02605 [Cycloclasticus sp. symbiont of Poecilosclerida sp. M]
MALKPPMGDRLKKDFTDQLINNIQSIDSPTEMVAKNLFFFLSTTNKALLSWPIAFVPAQPIQLLKPMMTRRLTSRETMKLLLAREDKTMYRAKKDGRNRVVISSSAA